MASPAVAGQTTRPAPSVNAALPRRQPKRRLPPKPLSGSEKTARMMGWFSIGLGLAEVLAPRPLARAVGLNEHYALLPLLGVREIVTGVGILSCRRPTGWMWARVLGDALDAAYLHQAGQERDVDHERLQIASAAVLGVAAVDAACAAQLSRYSR